MSIDGTKKYTVIFLLFLVALLAVTYVQASGTDQADSSGCKIEQKMDFILLDRAVTFDNKTILLNTSLLNKYNMSPEDIFVRDSLIKRMMGSPQASVAKDVFLIQINITLADRWDKVVVYNKTVC